MRVLLDEWPNIAGSNSCIFGGVLCNRAIRGTLRKYLDHYLPIVCRSLGLETFLLPIKADNLKKLENGGNIDEVLEIQMNTNLLGPRKLSPRKTPRFVGIRMICLIFLVWFAVLLVNVSLLSLITLAMYLPHFAFRLEGETIHGPYGLFATVLVAWLSWQRREKILNLCNQFNGPSENILLYVVIPILNTSLLSFVFGAHPKPMHRDKMQVCWSSVYIYFLSGKENCTRCVLVHLYTFSCHSFFTFFVVKSTTEGHILETTILRIETFYACQRWIVTCVKEYIGGIWSSAFFLHI